MFSSCYECLVQNFVMNDQFLFILLPFDFCDDKKGENGYGWTVGKMSGQLVNLWSSQVRGSFSIFVLRLTK